MTIIGIIIALLAISVPVSIVDTYWNKKRTKVMEAQNVLLWAMLEEAKNIMIEGVKELNNKGESTQ
jgi:hypothetical protein